MVYIKTHNYSSNKVKFCEILKPSADYFVILLIKMKVLQQLPKIILTLTFLALVQIGMANPVDTNGKKEDNTEGKKDQQQQEGQQQGNQKLDGESSTSTKEDSQGEVEVSRDTVEDDSISKYNFIFHFLYKFKYEQEEEL